MSEALAPPPRPGLLSRAAAVCSERSNPILVRYVRQQIRSRAFIAVFSIVLGFSTLFALTVGASAGHQSEGDAGLALFGLLTAVWTFAVWVFEPISAFRATAAERDDKTWDLLRLTGLTPGQLVRGMFLASLFQGVIYAAAIAPFLVMAYLLRGLALSEIGLVLLLVPTAGACASAGAIFLGCLGHGRGARNALGVVVAVASGLIWFSSLTAWLNFGFVGHFFLDDLADGAALAIALDFAAVWIGGTLVLGAAVLRHPAANRSTAPRVYAYLVLLNGVLWAFVLGDPVIPETLAVGAFFGALAAVTLGAFAVTEDYALTPRQARESARMRPWQLPFLFAPGAARGRFAFVTLAALVLGTAALAASGLFPSFNGLDWDDEPLVLSALILAHGATLLAVGDGLARTLLRRSVPTPLVRRVFLLALAVGLAFIGAILASVLGERSLIVQLFPIPGLAILSDRPSSGEDAIVLILLAGAVSALSLLVQGFRRGTVLQRTGDQERP